MTTESIKIGVVGLGTVGAGVVRALRKNRAIVRARCGVDLEVRRVAELDGRKIRAVRLPAACVTKDYRVLLKDPEIHIIVELIGGTEAARDLVLAALRAGKHVVTANKALLAKHWRQILSLAHKRGCAVGTRTHAAECGYDCSDCRRYEFRSWMADDRHTPGPWGR